jgi:protein O-mannosyl-transferase
MSARKDKAARKTAVMPVPAAAAPPPAPRFAWKRHGGIAAVLLLLVLAAYSNSFRSGFVFDNKPVILQDPRVHAVTPSNIHAIWWGGYWFDNSDPTLYRPLTTFSYLFNYAILGNGANPAGYHWINLALHLLNTLLVYALGLALFRKTPAAAALAAVWAVHPVLTESVTNIVGRADMLSCAGVLGGLLCRLKAGSALGARKFAWIGAVACASAVAIFSKESGIVLLAVILIYDLTFQRDAIKASIPIYAAAAAPVAIFLYMRSQVLPTLPTVTVQFVNNPLVGMGFWAARLTALQVMGRYMLLIVWPARLSSDYSYNQIPLFHGTFDNWGDWATVLGVLACGAAVWLVAAQYRRNREAFFLGALFFVALAPTANIAILVGTIMAERLLYLPAIGFIGCAVYAAFALTGRLQARRPHARSLALYAAAVICASLLVRTYVRNGDWESPRTLFETALRASPGSYKTHLNWAVTLAENKSALDRAIGEGEIALAILKPLPPDKDEDFLTYSDMGMIYRQKGDQMRNSGTGDAAAQSRQWYEKSLEVLARGIAVDQQRSEMLRRLDQAVGHRTYLYGAFQLYREQGQSYIRIGEPKKALEPLEYAAFLHPDGQLFQFEAEAYAALHDSSNAAIALMEALVIEPGEQALASELVDLYQREPANCAVQNTGGGNSLNLGCPLVEGHLCTAAQRVSQLYERRGDPAAAAKTRHTAAASFGCPAQ